MKLSTKSSKWMITNSSFFMRAPSGGGICRGPLFGPANFMWWCALKDTWGVSFLFLLYVVSLFAFHYMLTFRTMCISSLEGGFRKIYFLFMYCISVLCLYLFFYFCLVIFYSICFSVSICCFYFVVAFYFLFCCTCFTIFTYMNIKNTDFTTAIFLCFVEFRHFLMFFIGFLTCIICKRCIIFSW